MDAMCHGLPIRYIRSEQSDDWNSGGLESLGDSLPNYVVPDSHSADTKRYSGEGCNA